MQNKWPIFITVILLLIIAFFSYKPNHEIEVNHEPVNDLIVIEKKKDQAEIKFKAQEVIVEKQKINSEIASINQSKSLSPLLVMNTYRFCFRYFANKNKDGYDIFKRFNQKLNDFQVQYFEDYYQYCEQLNQQHPEYHLTKMSQLNDDFASGVENELWKQIIDGKIEASSLTNDEIENLIKQNDLEILTHAPDYLKIYYEEVMHWGIEEVLQNRQYDYVNYILKSAHQLYLCDIGADCTAQSSTMAMYCFLTPESCGLNYPDFVESVLTASQQQDIVLAYNYLLNKYN